jgi:polysaccharide biosynthesis protein PslJ
MSAPPPALATGGLLQALRCHPNWPIYLLFAGVPLWWVLGISRFMLPVVGGFMLLSLLLRQNVRVPPSVAIWALLLTWMLLSAVALDGTGRIFGFALRFSIYTSVGIFLLYLYNSRISPRAIVLSLATFWAAVVVGGYLGMLFPEVSFHTPAERFIPGSLLANDYVHDMAHARFAEVQDVLGEQSGRPATFFTYTNGWGSGFALLAPFALAAFAEIRTPRWKLLLAVTVAASIVPAVDSLNRGMWISLAVAAVYVIARAVVGAKARLAVRLVALAAITVLVIAASPLGSVVGQRLEHGHSDQARQTLYSETFARALDSPLIGYGAPRPAETSGYLDSAGTQGQVLYLVFSHGFPGLVLFYAWLAYTFAKSTRPSTPAAYAGHVTILIAAVQAPFYGLLGQLFIVAAGAVVALKGNLREPARVWVGSREPSAGRWSSEPLPAR